MKLYLFLRNKDITHPQESHRKIHTLLQKMSFHWLKLSDPLLSSDNSIQNPILYSQVKKTPIVEINKVPINKLDSFC